MRLNHHAATGWSAAGRRSPKINFQAWWLNGVAGASLLILLTAFFNRAAVHAPSVRATVETLITACATTAAWTVRIQFARTRRLRDLLLFGSLLMLALVEFSSYWLPAVFAVQTGSNFAAASLCGKLCPAAVLAAAAFAPSNGLILRSRRAVAITAVLAVCVTALSELLGQLLRGQLVSPAMRPLFGVTEAVRHPLALGLVLCTTVLFVYAAIGFARAAGLERDSVLSLLAGACLLAAAARLYFLPMPWLAPDWIAPREGLRLLGFGLILAAGIRRELRTRARIATAAAIAERRRVAQDLHDGLAQDLALIAAYGSRIADQLGGEHPVTAAATRALDVARGAISELSDPAGATTLEALEAVAHDLRERFGITVAVDVELDAEPAPRVQEQITRIAREAIANAARHGGAENVIVSLTRTESGVALLVRDDGCGIESAGWSREREGFGLRSMRERAAAVGGDLRIQQTRKRGTELEVMLP